MTDFKNQLEADRVMIEGELSQRMDQLPDGLQKPVVDAMKYSLLGGGKRIRGVLVLEFCRLCGGSLSDALPLAAAVEMVHAYSLIHDDLPCMDDDDLRRGKPSCHIAFGEDIALLAGDGLLTYAFETAASSSLEPGLVLQAIQQLAVASGTFGMIGGQVLDIKNMAENLDTLRSMCQMKTGALIRASAKLGCIAAGGDPAELERADLYGQKMGLAFQITDDILDLVGDTALLGKPVGSDQQQGKTTFTTLLPVEAAQVLADELLEESIGMLEPFGDAAAFLIALTRQLAGRRN